ncbi:hypothetical protein ASG45_05055 [Microbacterium sp. Leaf436]|nr:hypothetical protein ASG45_05055 [Microbacterium sp. Leaf436]
MHRGRLSSAAPTRAGSRSTAPRSTRTACAVDLPFIAGQLGCDSVPVSARCFAPLTVPEGSYLVMGDDCACFVPRADMVGTVFAIVWPVDRLFSPLG